MTAYKIQLSIDLKSIETKMICLHMSVSCRSIYKEQQFEEDPMWIKKKMYVVSRFFIGKTPVGILRNEKAMTKGM